MNSALLLAEPEPSTREFLQRHLADDGFDVLGAEADREALELLERLKPSLVLSSPELCRRLREGEPGRSWDREVPVIVLGGTEADSVDRVRAFDRGCDDYVPRPFHYDELLARIRAVLRRTSPSLRDRLEAGPIAVDLVTRRATVHGRALTLPAKEYDLLAKLATEPEAGARLHQGAVAARGVGLRRARPNSDARLALVTAAAEAAAGRCRSMRGQHLGRRLSALGSRKAAVAGIANRE
ncbi:MAG: response regulator transcription factor [Actinobacteria bacterium]|nr:MAG: response regulator transcription factor [Actinomycetota bacterium]